MERAQLHPLRQLARLYGVQTSYYDVSHRRREASPEALLAVLQALGSPVDSLENVPEAIVERQRQPWVRGLETVLVAWNGVPGGLEVRLPLAVSEAALPCQVVLESGEVRTWMCHLGRLPTQRATEVLGERYVAKRLTFPSPLPLGYHRLKVEVPGRSLEAMIIAAPLKAYLPANPGVDRAWGVFLPLYALHAQRSWGAGDLSDLDGIMAWAAGLGGGVVGVLPLLASFLDEPLDPSPYAPASRLFWNEFYLDLTRVPELKGCPSAQAILESAEFRRQAESLRSSPLLDYRLQMTLKRRVLEEMAQCLFAERLGRHDSFRSFVDAHPEVEDYATFRAAGEQRLDPWPKWPQPLRDGLLSHGDYGEVAKRYHLYVQWLVHQQMALLAEKARGEGEGLYLDLPLGVHPYGYDVWREREAFALEASEGAPPDIIFTRGQDWGFPPLHPERNRDRGYRYYRACLRHHLQHAGLLRIDHVMGLHRLFWIPKGMEPGDGVYVRYPAQELYAILALESHRHQAIIVGEDLGTVPQYVRKAMARHKVQRTFVVQYELGLAPAKALPPVPADAVASLNTHDMPPFAAFWRALDVQDRMELGLLDSVGARAERKSRQALKGALSLFLRHEGWLKGPATQMAVLKACLAYLSASSARIVIVNLEDLWRETQPQNVPGTRDERPNWRRRARYSFEEFSQDRQVLDVLREVAHLRRGGAVL